jgi:hypothetical protein
MLQAKRFPAPAARAPSLRDVRLRWAVARDPTTKEGGHRPIRLALTRTERAGRQGLRDSLANLADEGGDLVGGRRSAVGGQRSAQLQSSCRKFRSIQQRVF